MNPDFTGWQLRPEGLRTINDLRLVNCEINDGLVTRALGMTRLVELKLKLSKARYSGDMEYNETKIKLNKAYFYNFLEHEATIILNPAGDNKYQTFLLFSEDGKADQTYALFETFLDVLDLANVYYAKKKAEKGAKTLSLVRASHLN